MSRFTPPGQPPVVSQAEAEAGTGTIPKQWTPERVKQAIDALAPAGAGADWGSIGGDIANQADLQAELGGKAASGHNHDAAYAAIDHTHLGGGGVTLADVYPVGCIYTTTVSANPATVFGFGTWTAFGAGRVLVGLDSGQAEFDTVEETGGAKTVTLAEAHLPPHSHPVNDSGHAHVQGVNSATTGGLSGYAPDTSTNTRVNSGYSTSSATTGITVGNTGGGAAFSILPPHIVVYFFKRTA